MPAPRHHDKGRAHAPDVSVRRPQIFSTERLGGAPVVVHGRIVGMLSASDLLDFIASLPEEQAEIRQGSERGILDAHVVEEAMTRGPIRSLGPDDPVTLAAEVMKNDRLHRLPIVEAGKLVGIISTVDLVRAVADNHRPPDVHLPQAARRRAGRLVNAGRPSGPRGLRSGSERPDPADPRTCRTRSRTTRDLAEHRRLGRVGAALRVESSASRRPDCGAIVAKVSPLTFTVSVPPLCASSVPVIPTRPDWLWSRPSIVTCGNSPPVSVCCTREERPREGNAVRQSIAIVELASETVLLSVKVSESTPLRAKPATMTVGFVIGPCTVAA
jgi:CBS domain-containing protein